MPQNAPVPRVGRVTIRAQRRSRGRLAAATRSGSNAGLHPVHEQLPGPLDQPGLPVRVPLRHLRQRLPQRVPEATSSARARSILSGASSLIGGLWGARNAANAAQDITDRDARDKALQKACNEIMPLFHRCVRCNNWVDETCFNAARACASTAPRTSRPRWRPSARRSRSTRCARPCRARRSSRATPAPGRPNARTAASRSAREKFCGNCGTPLGVAKCPKCGAELAAGTRFCGNCGNKVG